MLGLLPSDAGSVTPRGYSPQLSSTGMARSFDEVLSSVEKVDGWMTDDQARRLWDHAVRLAPGDQIVEIGSFRGRSTVVLAFAAPDGVRITAIDPHAGNDRGPQEISGFEEQAAVDHDVFHENLRTAGVDERVQHARSFSQEALGKVEGDVDLLYIDGAHRYTPALADIRVWGARVRSGGTMLIHDSFSSVGVTLAILRALLLGYRFRYVGRSQSMTEYRRELVTGTARLRNAAAQLAQLPWFARNLFLKLLIVAKLKRGPWPY
jgi:predicted O-methyltransferase YrrM